MHRTVRMLGIIMALQARPMTTRELAERFECSTKTIQRDLAGLEELQIPVRATQGYGGGVRLEDGWWLGSPNLSANELELLILALEASPPSDVHPALLEKLRGSIRPHHFDKVADDPTRPIAVTTADAVDTVLFETIRKAINRQSWLRMEYAGSSRSGERRVHPTSIYVAGGHWYCEVIDERSRENRRFRIDRITSAMPCLAPADADDIVAAAASRPQFHDSSHPLVQCDLTPMGVRFCLDDVHFRNELSGNRLEFRCPPRELPFVGRELLRMGRDCRVIGPPELIAQMRSMVADLANYLDEEQDATLST